MFRNHVLFDVYYIWEVAEMDIQKLMGMMQKEDGTQPVSKSHEWDRLWNQYVEEKGGEYHSLSIGEAVPRMISAVNYQNRRDYYSCEELGIRVRVGDIAYIDFGEAYRNEIGFQHFGLILKLYRNKAFVVPMSGNYQAYLSAYGKDNPKGKKHLMRLGKLAGMNKESVLFINDVKWINTARIIDIKAHVRKNSKQFQDIRERVLQCLV